MSFLLPSASRYDDETNVIFISKLKHCEADFVYRTLIEMDVWKHKEKYLYAMGNLYYNLKLASFCAVRDGVPTRLAVPCRTGDYSVPEQYDQYSKLLSYSCTKKCIAELERQGYIQVFRGWFDLERGHGRRTTLLPTDHFRVVTADESNRVFEVELGGRVLLKDTKDNRKRLLPFEENELTKTTSTRLELINYTNALAFELPPTDDLPAFIYESSPFRYRRIFNDARWDHGGRFYATFQNMSAKMRREIRCQRGKVRELDYGGMQLRMLYHLEGMELKGDPYEFPNLAVSRNDMKKVCLIALNVKDMQQAYRTLIFKSGFNHLAHQRHALIAAFKEKHEPIEKYFTSNIGIELQRRDSDIALEIMWHFACQAKPCLSVHDSFIVAEDDVEELCDIMVQAYYSEIGYYPVVKDENGHVIFSR